MIVTYDFLTNTASGNWLTAFQKPCQANEFGRTSLIEYDADKHVLRVRRDKIGLQTIYYAQLPTSIVFATELKEILALLPRPQIRAHELAQPIRHNYPINLQNTWIEQIKRLRAGEEAIVDKDGLRLYTYWKRDFMPSFQGTKGEAIAETLRLMRQSVRKCIETADGPVAVLLSGGIDSSSLAAFAKEMQQEVHVISAGYKGNKYTACDEREVAKQFAAEKGLIYHEVELNEADFEQLLDELLPYLDEPCFDVSCMAQYALYKKAAEMGFKVILSGLGGDEQFYSYKNDNAAAEALRIRCEHQSLFPLNKHKREFVAFMAKHWNEVIFANKPILLNDRLLTPWTYDDYYKFAIDAQLDYAEESVRFSAVDVEHQFRDSDGINEIYDFVFSTFANQLCVYLGNKLGAANGVELRYPLLDADLVAFLDTLPLSMKYDPKRPKQYQKDVMAGIVPDYILYAKKRGFEPPFEFIRSIAARYQYKHIQATHKFFNSVVADKIIDNFLYE